MQDPQVTASNRGGRPRFTQVIPSMIPSIQYPARAADPPQSALSPHEPEKRPQLELFANTVESRDVVYDEARLLSVAS
jgi:hypothetical protein